jgi:hypothetical protein
MDKTDLDELTEAVRILEHPGWTAKLTNLIGVPIESALRFLPKTAHEFISQTTEKALTKALTFAISTMDARYRGRPFRWLHKIAAATSGGLGGLFGLPGLVWELPVSTGIMLRSIADIARSEGENLEDVGARLACLEVFAFGGRKSTDDALETAYYSVRIALARTFAEAGQFILERGFLDEGAPVIVRLIAKISSRFGVVVSEKAAADAVPILGSVGGATVNVLFINFFQSIARGHFLVRRLERKWGEDIVKMEYERIARELDPET